MKKLDVELTQVEHDLLVFLLGIATNFAAHNIGPNMAKATVNLTNKLLAGDPDFHPYDPDTYDPTKIVPFTQYPRQ